MNGATEVPLRHSAAISPVATVVFPLPEAGAAITIALVRTVITVHPFDGTCLTTC
ncbi:hypothetical protein GCM10023321_41910 [Pseudonocardia eucalypti]|uniref:Uncharacterized protein n=1 Tax=Pseudonocardia eucalypti TaxID=648755 RepID=A0ABP9QDB0_9PSEU